MVCGALWLKVPATLAESDARYPQKGVPMNKSADFTLGPDEHYIINTKNTGHLLVTLPAASLWPGRVVNFLNNIDWRIKSATVNVIPKEGGVHRHHLLANLRHLLDDHQ